MDNIFDLQDDNTVTIPEDVDYVDQLVGEGKKFKDISALAKGKAESDAYIDRLRKQLEESNKELSTRMTLEKFLEAQKGQSQQPVDRDPPVVEKPSELTEDALLAKMEEILSRRDAAKAQETNIQKVSRIMKEQFGDRVSGVINHKANELGMSVKSLENLAASSPQAFLTLVGASESIHTPVAPVIPRNGFNSAAQPSDASVRNAKYYERMKQVDPKRYWAPETVSEMIKDRAALGESKFYS